MFTRRPLRQNQRRSWIIKILVLVIVFGLSLFIARNTAAIRQGPQITLENPSFNVSKSAMATIAGHVKYATTITIANRPITISVDGNFSQPLLVPVGYTIIPIEATDRYGQVTQVITSWYRSAQP